MLEVLIARSALCFPSLSDLQSTLNMAGTQVSTHFKVLAQNLELSF